MDNKKRITRGQLIKLARLLEERGFDSHDFQQKLLNNIRGLVFFLNEGFGLKGDWLVKDDHGFLLEMVEGAILGVTLVEFYSKGDPYIRVGDKVFSKRGYFRKGKAGTVVNIRRPYFDGCAKDILLVDFNNGEEPKWVKFRDVKL